MKLPFSLSLQLIFRLLFPGAVVALALLPIEWLIITSLVIPVEPAVFLFVSIFFWGWIIVLMDMPLYMLFEGRRFWPVRLRIFMQKREQHRLDKLLQLSGEESADTNSTQYLEAITETQGFPITKDGIPYAEYPTRLGNSISAFEVYPDVKYGMPSSFYASRLWVKLEHNLRKELDNTQAVADSGIYMAFALYLSAFLVFIYSIAEFLFGIDMPFISHNGAWLVTWMPLAMFGYVIYRIDIYAQSQYGDMFKAVFDVHRAELTFDGLSEEIDGFILNPGKSFEGVKANSMKIWRYLQWHKVRPPGEDRNYTAGEWHKKQLKGGTE